MTFREFLEAEGAFGQVKTGGGEIGPIRQMIKSVLPVKNKGTSVSRMMSAGKVKSPARPAGLTTPNKPLTLPSTLS